MTVTGTVASRSAPEAGQDGSLRLRVLATSDLHAHLFPFNYFADRRDDDVGLVGLAALIEQHRADCPNVLLFDNGDTLQGAPLGDAAVSELMPQGHPHPMIAAMNGLGYDAATLGNHDFDYGLEALDRALLAARYPVVLANARRTGTECSLVAPHVILERHVIDDGGAVRILRVGVTGAAPPQIMQWGRAQLAGLIEMEPIVPAVAREVARMRAAGADLVVVLAHTGLGQEDSAPDAENVGRVLAQLPGVDAIVAGHTHRLFPPASEPQGLIAGTPLVQPGFWGSHLGQIDLMLRPADGDAGAGGRDWLVASAQARLVALGDTDAADRAALRRRLRRLPVFRTEMARGHRLTRAYAARPLGRTAVPLETYFSFLAPCAATQLIAEAQRAAVRDIIVGDEALATLPLLSCTTPFKAGGRGGPGYYTDIPAGAILLRHAADLYAYANGLALLRVTGAQLRDWLERSASAFRQVIPGGDGSDRPQPLIDLDFASYNFDRMDGLRYEIDVSQPARTSADGETTRDGAARIRNLRLACGLPVRDDMAFLVVTNTYRSAGGGHFPAAAAAQPVFTTPEPVRNALFSYISQARGPIDPVVTPCWSFAPLGSTQVCYETGPGAAAHPTRAAELGLTPDGMGSHGFARYVLTL